MWWAAASSGVSAGSLLRSDFIVLLLVGEVEEHLVFGLVEDGEGPYLSDSGVFYGGLPISSVLGATVQPCCVKVCRKTQDAGRI